MEVIKIKWKVFIYGFLIVILTNIIVTIIRPYFSFIRDDSIWNAFGVSFGFAYLITYNLDYTQTKGSVKKQKLMNFVFALVTVFLIFYGISKLFIKLFPQMMEKGGINYGEI